MMATGLFATITGVKSEHNTLFCLCWMEEYTVLTASAVVAARRFAIAFAFACLGALAWASCAGAADEVKIAGTGSALGGMRLLAEAYGKFDRGTKVSVLPSLGSSGGIKAVLAGAVDIGVSSRPLRDNERARGAIALEYARTPFVFATADVTKATGISLADLPDIYRGKIRTWPDGTRIWLVMRPKADSDSTLIDSISPEVGAAVAQARERPGLLVAVTDQECAMALEKHIGSLGPSTLALISSENRKLKALELNGIEPTASNLAAGIYPYYKPLYIVTHSKTSKAARKFVAFVQSNAGQKVLRQTGHAVPPFGADTRGPR